jgi:hypothetical protein
MRDSIALLFQRTGAIVQKIIFNLLTTIASAIEPARPGRKYQRNHKRSQRKYSLNYKPILKVNDIDLDIVVVIHNLRLALRFADRVVLLNEGRLFAAGGPEIITSEAI